MANILPTSPTQIAETWTIATWEEFLAEESSGQGARDNPIPDFEPTHPPIHPSAEFFAPLL